MVDKGNEAEVTEQKIKDTPVGKVSREDVLLTLQVEGGLILTVEDTKEITDESIISAQHHVIANLVRQKRKLIADNVEVREKLNQFYREVTKLNIRIIPGTGTGDKIRLEPVSASHFPVHGVGKCGLCGQPIDPNVEASWTAQGRPIYHKDCVDKIPKKSGS